MKAQLKKTLIGMAAGAFGIAMIACGGDVEVENEGADGTETAGGEASYEETETAGAEEVETETETDTEIETETETETETDVEG